jgi:outer membrane protein assembly factor BamB
MRSLFRLVLIALLSLAAGCSTVKGWFSDDDFDPREPVQLQKINEQVKLKSRWSRGVGDGQGEGLYKINPVLVDNTLFAASAEGDVAAVDAETGRVRWKRDMDLALSGGVGHYGGSIFVGASEGLVMRLSADNGDEIWRTAVSGEVLSAPQGDGQYVIAQTYDGKLMGFDYETGEIRWTYTSDVPVLTLRGTGTPMIIGDNAVAGFADGKVVAINVRSGNVAWEARVAIPQGTSEIERIVDIDGSMALQGSELYVASYQGRVVAIDTRSGRRMWQRNVSSVSGVGVGFGNVYVADDDGTVSGFLRNGQGCAVAKYRVGISRAFSTHPGQQLCGRDGF